MSNELVAESSWVHTLTADQRRRVDTETVVRSIAKGAYVCRSGEAVQSWIGVVEGLVKISTVSLNGKLATFSGVAKGGWFGEGSLLKDEPRHYEAIALRDSRVAYLPRALFLTMLDNNPRFCRFMLEHINERLGQAMSIIQSQRLLGPEGRVARCVASLFNATLYPGTGRTLQVSQEEIALLAGLSRQRVNQSLKMLQDHGLIDVQYGAIVVTDLEGLRAFEG